MSELHNRLAHLVNYSSQLIFVSGNSIADQQKTLNDFLASQQENTEISYFSAELNKTHQEYRGSICRQLAGHTVGSFIRPLVDLLKESDSGLSADKGPYLLCITQAENLDQSFLQELWDWVMQTQQGDKKLHLNVILFGESNWANEAQEWLPMQNSHKPVLLSSESVDPTGFDVNALEALMADKNSWLSTSNQPIVSNKWFIGSILSVFFVVFVGLMAWQYPQEVMDVFENDEQALPAPSTLKVDDNKRETAQEDLNVDAQITNHETEAEKETSFTDTLLVKNWSNEVEVNEHSSSETQVHQSQDKLQNVSLDQNNAQQIDKENNTLPNKSDIDFQVPDIISVEQLDAKLDQKIIQKTKAISTDEFLNAAISEEEQASTIAQSPPEQETKSITLNNSAIQNPLSALNFKFDETTLLSLPTDAIVLQLSGIQNPVVLENYLNNNNLKSSTWVYETQRYGGPWYVVVYNQSFDSIDAALRQLSILPEDVKEAQPFAKRIDQIKLEISRR